MQMDQNLPPAPSDDPAEHPEIPQTPVDPTLPEPAPDPPRPPDAPDPYPVRDPVPEPGRVPVNEPPPDEPAGLGLELGTSSLELPQ